MDGWVDIWMNLMGRWTNLISQISGFVDMYKIVCSLLDFIPLIQVTQITKELVICFDVCYIRKYNTTLHMQNLYTCPGKLMLDKTVKIEIC